MKILSLFFSVVAVLGLTSCLGNSGGSSITQDFSPYCFSYVTDMQSNTSVATDGATYKLTTNPDDGLCTLSIGSLKLADGTHVSLEIKDQKYTFTQNGAMTVKLPMYTSVVNGVSHTLSDFNFEYYSRYLNGRSFPMIVASFTVDSRMDVRVVYNPSYYWGTTTVTDQDGKVYVNKAQTSFYGVQFNIDKKTATFGALNSKFAENMPALSMTFKDIPYNMTQWSYSLSSESLTPYIGETPYPDYKITDFSMSGTWGGAQQVKFTCTIDTEKVKGTYKVVAVLGILPPATNSNN